MKIQINESKPIDLFPYLEVGSGQLKNGRPVILHKNLPIYSGKFSKTASDLDYLVICSDLQGMVEDNGSYILLGEALAEYLKLFFEVELEVSSDAKIGVLLCGDLYTNLEKRGSSGDVRTVWRSFEDQFDWVVGVAGNHDRFGNDEELEVFKQGKETHLLHKEVIVKDALRIAGISGIIGRGDKVNRLEEGEYLSSLKKLLKQNLDLLLLHETPDYPTLGLIGNTKIREVIENAETSSICCGHCFWEKTLIELENESKIINVYSKVVIFENLRR